MAWQPRGVLWPDVEALVVAYLSAVLDGVWVAAAKAPDRPLQVVVRDDGGEPLGDIRATARIGVNVWAPDHEQTAELAAIVTAALNDWPNGAPVVSVRATRAYPVADEAGPLRYLTAELVVRGLSFDLE